MARSSKEDPVEKFRFRVTVVAVTLGATAFESLSRKTAVLSRLGFSEITLPKVTMNEMTYRENIDNQRSIKVPGLAKYEPVVLRRGVTTNRDLYEWFRLVNEELALLVMTNELVKDAKYTPAQSDNFRKDVIIEVLDRKGEPVKAWYLFNAWPSSYIPGNDLNASSEEKLVEEVTLTYEFFLELEGGLAGLGKELAKGALIQAAEWALEKLGGGNKFPF
jgi:phage tail-like protein